MKILIDTHVLLWLWNDDPKLSSKAREIYFNTQNKLFVSAATLWEIGIKLSLGKVVLKQSWFPHFKKNLEENSLLWLPISAEHCHQVSVIPFHYRDPFDRMLVSQAIVDEMQILTIDRKLKDYGVECIW